VLNHVLLHQTVVGQEARKQLDIAGADPDVIVGCVGGGSNFAGLVFPFLADAAAGAKLRIVAAEPTACPTLSRGHYAYDFGDTAKLTPLLPMHTLGHDFLPAGIHAGGLRYHGMAPLVSHLVHTGLVEARAYEQRDCFAAAITFAQSEGIIPAPEASHAIRAVFDEVERAREDGAERTILFNLSGHGNFDMGAYDAYLSGGMVDAELPQAELDRAAECWPTCRPSPDRPSAHRPPHRVPHRRGRSAADATMLYSLRIQPHFPEIAHARPHHIVASTRPAGWAVPSANGCGHAPWNTAPST